MKIALVHELLTMKGGAERVLRIAADMFPDAPIYTLLYNEKKLGDWFPKERVKTSSIQDSGFRIPDSEIFFNHHLHLTKFPEAIEQWDFSDFDLVLSFSSAFAHGIITNGRPKHISYIHSPARYLWDRTHDVLKDAGKGIFGPLKRKYLEHTFHNLRIWDCEAAARPDKLLAASKEVQRRIELYWRRESDVVYPPVDDHWLKTNTTVTESRGSPLQSDNYFLIVSTLVPYKRIDIAIEAANKGNLKLKIVGDGPDKSRLEKLACPTVEFLGYNNHDEIKELYKNAHATIFPGDEDFGLVPIESMSQGTPVIAYKKGGALETVTEGVTGLFFKNPTADSLLAVAKKLESYNFDFNKLKSQAEKFSSERFEEEITKAVDELL
ncbi:glycosyltransferase [Patescibacteria group bacterium]|nr:glycosyltransferase [Patescibacteria group bacterium]MBU1123809.1 glycosyltransferase [Patescibacteria group bacterium]MBU1911702.1 glycosyltransferase [Patescibacteria group bacterium]